ncbi:hypothetical protein ACE1TI_03025 [Alteribacillus sp. JSM 102045]|uniref:hypothetical protein n=1 Tax=Alteribacillus sp. JSM 102045 TaxID=1562101 RepID=UPI0035BF1F46
MKKILWITAGLLGLAGAIMGISFFTVAWMSNLEDDTEAFAGESAVSEVEILEHSKAVSYLDDDGTLHIEDAVQHKIRETHDIMNGLVGWGELNFFQQQDHWLEKNEDIEKVYNEFKSMADASEGELQSDFHNLMDLIEYAVFKRDKEALKYAHRIIQDLDIIVNDYPIDDLYHVTNTSHNDAEIRSFLQD